MLLTNVHIIAAMVNPAHIHTFDTGFIFLLE